ncbi:MAG: carboxylating nicotinate-nucleotide diphosphorylase [Candidatus Omnitrophica bacterium]|nr:carboxylating nicotinate-nucleotide diphosphorylase [Candidatus Omnitrophota bacterium]
MIKDIIRVALKEDIGKGDITSTSIIPKDRYAKAILLAKEDCLVCGLDIARRVFKAQDKNIKFKPQVQDGRLVKKGKVIARLFGKAQSILIAERVALNFLSFLSGIATKTKKYVDRVEPYMVNPVRKSGKKIKKGFSNGVKIMDTRKTIPGLRELEKYAVRVGGGYNHRFRLDEMLLIKDNHFKVISCPMPALPRRQAGGMQELSVVRLKEFFKRIKNKKNVKVEIEVKSLKELKEVLKLKPDIIMLDNMSIKNIKKAVKIRGNLTPKLEVSGRVTLKNVRKIAASGVEMISIGDLTHSLKSIDMSLEFI